MPKHNSPNVGFIRLEVREQLPKIALVNDTVTETVKRKGEKYLPKPEAHTDKKINAELYKKYVSRAVFYPVTGRTLSGLVGQVFSKPVAVDLPDSLSLLETDMDGSGLSLEQHTKKTLSTVIKHGRSGLLSDFPRVEPGNVTVKADLESGKIRPRILTYGPAQIINWRENTIGGETRLSMLTLYEQKIVKDDGFEFEYSPRWRQYRLTDIGVTVTVWKKASDTNTSGRDEYEIDEKESTLSGADQNPLKEIPFAFVGAENNDTLVDESPLHPIAQLNIDHYRNSADYEQMLHNTGQATYVFSGLTSDWVSKHIDGKVTLGSITPVSLPVGAKAEILQAKSDSLPMEGMKHKEDQMKAIGAKLIEPNTVERTATETEIEATSEASVLSSIAKNVSTAYEQAVYYCSLFIGAVEKDAIKIALNSEFQVQGLSYQERAEVIGAWQQGLITKEEAREVYRKKGIAFLPDDEAFEAIANEAPSFGAGEE